MERIGVLRRRSKSKSEGPRRTKSDPSREEILLRKPSLTTRISKPKRPQVKTVHSLSKKYLSLIGSQAKSAVASPCAAPGTVNLTPLKEVGSGSDDSDRESSPDDNDNQSEYPSCDESDFDGPCCTNRLVDRGVGDESDFDCTCCTCRLVNQGAGIRNFRWHGANNHDPLSKSSVRDLEDLIKSIQEDLDTMKKMSNTAVRRNKQKIVVLFEEPRPSPDSESKTEDLKFNGRIDDRWIHPMTDKCQQRCGNQNTFETGVSDTTTKQVMVDKSSQCAPSADDCHPLPETSREYAVRSTIVKVSFCPEDEDETPITGPNAVCHEGIRNPIGWANFYFWSSDGTNSKPISQEASVQQQNGGVETTGTGSRGRFSWLTDFSYPTLLTCFFCFELLRYAFDGASGVVEYGELAIVGELSFLLTLVTYAWWRNW